MSVGRPDVLGEQNFRRPPRRTVRLESVDASATDHGPDVIRASDRRIASRVVREKHLRHGPLSVGPVRLSSDVVPVDVVAVVGGPALESSVHGAVRQGIDSRRSLPSVVVARVPHGGSDSLIVATQVHAVGSAAGLRLV